jgi:hypothetical protein
MRLNNGSVVDLWTAVPQMETKREHTQKRERELKEMEHAESDANGDDH